MKFITLSALVYVVAVSAAPSRRAEFTLKNGQDAIALNNKFKNLKASAACKDGENACIEGKFAQCANGKFVVTACAGGTICAALPLVNKAGTSVTCTTQEDLDRRLAATGATGAGNGGGQQEKKGNQGNQGGNQEEEDQPEEGADAEEEQANAGNQRGKGKGGNGGGGGNPQTSFTLDPSVIASGFAQDGQATPDPGQVPSLTSKNNFINFCVGKTITNGKQIREGSCNPAPIGQIPSFDKMPSSKFIFPKNKVVINENEPFTIKMAIKNIQTGNFVNPQTNYFAAPQQLNGGGTIIGHSHVVIEKLNSLTQETPTDPRVFAFFKGVNTAAKNGVLSTAVDKGLPAGIYRLGSMNAAMNHQPAIGPVAQHGMFDDIVYFEVKKKGRK